MQIPRRGGRMRYAPTLVRLKLLPERLILDIVPRRGGRMRYAPTLVRL